MSRYFIVFYVGTYEGRNLVGQISYVTENGIYINREFVQKDIARINGAQDIVLTNIIELTEQDYNVFSYKQDSPTPSPAG